MEAAGDTGNIIGARDTVGVHTGDPVCMCTGDPADVCTGDPVGVSLGDPVGVRTGDLMDMHTGDLVGERMGDLVGVRMGDLVGVHKGDTAGVNIGHAAAVGKLAVSGMSDWQASGCTANAKSKFTVCVSRDDILMSMDDDWGAGEDSAGRTQRLMKDKEDTGTLRMEDMLILVTDTRDVSSSRVDERMGDGMDGYRGDTCRERPWKPYAQTHWLHWEMAVVVWQDNFICIFLVIRIIVRIFTQWPSHMIGNSQSH